MQISTITIIALLAVIIAEPVVAQEGCEKIDKSRPSIYIGFEKDFEENVKGKRKKKTLLKLTNNTTCEIVVETDGKDERSNSKLYSAETIKGENGSLMTRYTQLPVDGLEKNTFYDVRKSEKLEWAAANYYEDRHMAFHFTIFPGLSVFFPTDQEHTRKPYRLSVQFEYRWENSSFENVKHRTFYWYELSKGYEETSEKRPT